MKGKRDSCDEEAKELQEACITELPATPLTPALSVSGLADSGTETERKYSVSSIACQTEVIESCNVTTEVDDDFQCSRIEDDPTTSSNGLDESYLRVCLQNILI